jgi:hypothetical protein
VDFCVKTLSIVPSICPKFREASQLDDSVLQLLSAPSNGWLNDADSLRSMLSNIKQKWTELGLPGESFYQETQEEAAALETRLDRRQGTQRLQEFLSRQLGCDHDGWVAADRWDEISRSIARSTAASLSLWLRVIPRKTLMHCGHSISAEADELETFTNSFTVNAKMSLKQSDHWPLLLQNGIHTIDCAIIPKTARN